MKKPKKFKFIHQRKYYMNRKLKEYNIDFNIKTGEIKLPYKRFADIPIGLRFYIGECIKLQYNVQYEIEGTFKIVSHKNQIPEVDKVHGPKLMPTRSYIKRPKPPAIENQIDLF